MKLFFYAYPEKKFRVGDQVLRVFLATNFFTRFCGLMLRKKIPPAHGLLLSPCASVHMCFMRFPMDAVFLDENCRVLKVKEHLWPWLGLAFCRGAKMCLELAAGEAARLGLTVGEQLTAA